MTVTLTPVSRSADASITLSERNGNSSNISTGSPIGLLLALTYASQIVIDGMVVTLLDRN